MKILVSPKLFMRTPLRVGGIAAIISLSFFYYIYYLLYSKVLYEYIFISYTMFLIGFTDDLKLALNHPKDF